MQPRIVYQVGWNPAQVTQVGQQIAAHLARGMGSVRTSAFNQPLGKITGSANEFQKSLEASNARVIAFGASAGAIYAVRAAFQKLLTSTVEVEKGLTDINVLLNLSARGLSEFSSSLFRVANETSQSFANAAKTAQEFARQGLGAEEVLKRTKDALILNKLSGLQLEEAVSSLTAAINSFGREALNTTLIVDKLSNVDAQFAVSAADLAESLKRVGSSASDANVKFNEMLGLITAAKQITARDGSVIGNSFKTIFTRLQRPQVLDDLEAVGVASRNAVGAQRPLIDVLSDLANNYDNLSTSQRSFITEAVGGVFQINTLKAVLSDLGNGFSIYEQSVRAAEVATFSAQKRITDLNKTISAQMTVAGNEWTRALSNLGNLSAASPIRGGLAFAQKTGRTIGDLTDPNSTGAVSGAASGVAKSVSTFLSGPGVQFAVFTIMKLMERLTKFAADAIKDFRGLNETAKNRADVQKAITQFLDREKSILNDVLNGNLQIADVQTKFQNGIIETNNHLETQAAIVAGIVKSFERMGSLDAAAKAVRQQTNSGINSAGGYIPNLSTERELAKQGGYNAGMVVGTRVKNGGSSLDVIANTAETKSSVKIGGKEYEWVNPPKNSPAGRRHADRSMAATGIDPYTLSQKNLAGGFVPNLAATSDLTWEQQKNAILELTKSGEFKGFKFSDDQRVKLIQMMEGVKPGKGKARDEKGTFHSYSMITLGSDDGILNRLGAGITTEQRQNILERMKGAMGIMKGGKVAGLTKGTKEGDDTNFDASFEDVQNMVKNRSSEFTMLTADVAGSGLVDFKKEFKRGSTLAKYEGRFGMMSLKGPGAEAAVRDVKDTMAMILKSMKISRITNEGQTFGNLLDSRIKEEAARMGIEISSDDSETFDGLTTTPEFSKNFLGGAKIGAWDAKNSASKDNQDNMAGKVVRMLAGVSKQDVPVFSNIAGFDPNKGRVGILDSNYLSGENSMRAFRSLVFKATASGKPMKSIIGAPGSGKTTMAKNLGGFPVVNESDVENAAQFIFLSSSRDGANMFKGWTGLALSSSSSITGLDLSSNAIQSNIAKRTAALNSKYGVGLAGAVEQVAGLDPADTRTVRELLTQQNFKGGAGNTLDYSAVFEKLKKKFGDRFKPNAAMGGIPNLAAVAEAMSRENRATGGRAKLSSHPDLATSDNPLGLVAIDSSSQKNASEAIKQHKMMGQSMSEIKKAHTATGHVPNLALDESSLFSTSVILGLAQWGKNLDLVNQKSTGWISKLKAMTSVTERQILADQQFIQSIDVARNKLLANEAVEVKGYGRFTGGKNEAERLEAATKVDSGAANNRLQVIQRQRDAERDRVTSIAGKVGIGGSLIAGLGGTIAKGTFGPDAGKALETVGSSLTTASQIAFAFPNSKAARGVGAGVVATGAFQGAKELGEGLQGRRDAFGKLQDKNQKLVASLDQLAQSLSNLDNMMLDASVGLDALNREHRRYAETLASLSLNGATDGQINEIQNASTSSEKIAKIFQVKSGITKNQETKAVDLEFAEQISKQKGLIGTLIGTGYNGGIFGYNTPAEKETSNAKAQSFSTSLYTRLTDEGKTQLTKDFSSPDFRQGFDLEKLVGGNYFEGDGGEDIRKEIKGLVDTLKKQGTAADKSLVENQLKFYVGQIAGDKNPKLIAARNAAIQNNEAASLPLEMAYREKSALQRLIVNGGSLNVANQVNLQRQGRGGVEDVYSKGSLALIREQNRSRVQGVFYDDYTNRTSDLSNQSKRNILERDKEMGLVRNSATSGLSKLFSRDLDKISDSTKSDDITGASITQIGPSKAGLINALNKGLQETIKNNGGMTGFVKNGTLSGDFRNQVLQNSGLDNEGPQKTMFVSLAKLLQSNEHSTELLEMANNLQSQEVDISRKFSDNQNGIHEELKALRQEFDIKELTSLMGGSKSLMDREGRRSMERDMRKGMRLMETGKTPESRARGAYQLLKGVQASGGNPLEIAKFDDKTGRFTGKRGNAQSNAVARALNMTSTGLNSVWGASMRRVGGTANAVGGDARTIFGATQGLYNQYGGRAAGMAVAADLRPRGANIVSDNEQTVMGATAGLNQALKLSYKPLENFAVNIEMYSEKIRELQETLIPQALEFKKAAEKKGKEIVSAASGETREGLPTAAQSTVGEGNKRTKLGSATAIGENSILPGLFAGLAARDIIKGGGKALVSKFFKRKAAPDIGTPDYIANLGKETRPKLRMPVTGDDPRNGLVMPSGASKPLPVVRIPVDPMAGKPIVRIPPRNTTPSVSIPVTSAVPGFVPRDGYSTSIGGRQFKGSGPAADERARAFYAAQSERARRNEARSLQSAMTGNQIPAKDNVPLRDSRGKFLPGSYGKFGINAGMPAMPSFGGMMGGIAPMIGGMAAQKLSPDNPMAYMGGMMATQMVMSNLPTAGAGLFTGGAGAALGASPLVAGAAVGATAYGGYKLGQGLYRGFNHDSFDGVAEGLDADSSRVLQGIQQRVKKGSSEREIRSYLNNELTSARDTVSTLSGPGTGKEQDAAKRAYEAIAKLKDVLPELIDSEKSKNENSAMVKKQAELLDAQIAFFKGGGQAAGGQGTSIRVEISLKDADKLPDVFAEKVIDPLKKQLMGLQGQVNNIVRDNGGTVNPASI